MTNEQIKHALISICVGAGVAFITTLFQGILEFVRLHLQDIVIGTSGTITYLMRTYNNS